MKKKAFLNYNLKGGFGIGITYVVLLILIILGAGTLMIGSIIPKSTVANGQTVVIITTTPGVPKTNLQLYTFPGVTLTPTPTPTPVPQPQADSSDGSGKGDGGHSAPKSGGGSYGGSAM